MKIYVQNSKYSSRAGKWSLHKIILSRRPQCKQSFVIFKINCYVAMIVIYNIYPEHNYKAIKVTFSKIIYKIYMNIDKALLYF